MQEATDASSGLTAQWDEVTDLLQEALEHKLKEIQRDAEEDPIVRATAEAVLHAHC